MHSNSLAFVLLKLLLMVNVVGLSRSLVLQHVLITSLHNGSAEGLRVGGRSRGLPPLRIGRCLSSLIRRTAGLRASIRASIAADVSAAPIANAFT